MHGLKRRPQLVWMMRVIVIDICAIAGTLKLYPAPGAAKLAEVTAERNALIEKVQSLQTTLDFTETDEYVIRTARNELGMIMPGEVRYVSGN